MKVVGLEDADVRRYPRTGLQKDNIARHDEPGRDGRHDLITQHRGACLLELAQSRGGLSGGMLLEAADDAVQDEHDPDEEAVLKVSQGCSKCGCDKQDVDERAAELQQESRQE